MKSEMLSLGRLFDAKSLFILNCACPSAQMRARRCTCNNFRFKSKRAYAKPFNTVLDNMSNPPLDSLCSHTYTRIYTFHLVNKCRTPTIRRNRELVVTNTNTLTHRNRLSPFMRCRLLHIVSHTNYNEYPLSAVLGVINYTAGRVTV